MQFIGWSSRPLLGLHRVIVVADVLAGSAAMHFWYAATVTSVFPNQNAPTLAALPGFSSSKHCVSCGSQPMWKLPAGK